MVFVPDFWNIASKLLGISRVISRYKCLFSNEETNGGFLDHFRMGAGHWKDQSVIRSLEFSVPPPTPGQVEGLESELRKNGYNHACITKPPESP